MRVDIENKKQEILNLIQQDLPIIQIARVIGCSRDTIKKYLKRWNISYKGNQGRKGMRNSRRKTSSELIESIKLGKTISNSLLRDRLLDDKLKEPKCEFCGSSIWFGKDIPLELHHKNFNHSDNNINNLAIVCPTCHEYLHKYKIKI